MRYLLIKLVGDPSSVPNTSYIKVASDGIDFTILETYYIKKALV